MPKANSLRVFEYESIVWKEGRRYHREGFKKDHYEAFESYFLAHEKTPFFELIPHGVRFKSYVGAIHIGKLTIEVLPKVDRNAESENDATQMQRVLLDMLKECTLLTAKETGHAPLKLRANSILHLYFELFLTEVEHLQRRGFFKQYRSREGQQKSLKGALFFSKHLSVNLVHKERFYTRHATYDHNHLVLQILHEALCLIDQIADSALLGDAIGRLKLNFPEVDRLRVNAAHFVRIPTSRKTEPYRKAIEIAKLLLLNFRPDISAGHNDMLALMFDMNVLWEEFILRKLQRAASTEFQVLGQRSKPFWETKTIRPDIVLISRKEPSTTWVIDTKWKVINSHQPADDDLKQMYVYNHHWEAQRSMLLYPRSGDQEDVRGKFRLALNGGEHECVLGFIDLVREGKLNRKMGEEIIEKLGTEPFRRAHEHR